MVCFEQYGRLAANIAVIHGLVLKKPYATKQECEQECESGTGACCGPTGCRSVKGCQCKSFGETFIGIGVPCTPNPCNPLP
jgi:hypothetical protein